MAHVSTAEHQQSTKLGILLKEVNGAAGAPEEASSVQPSQQRSDGSQTRQRKQCGQGHGMGSGLACARFTTVEIQGKGDRKRLQNSRKISKRRKHQTKKEVKSTSCLVIPRSSWDHLWEMLKHERLHNSMLPLNRAAGQRGQCGRERELWRQHKTQGTVTPP